MNPVRCPEPECELNGGKRKHEIVVERRAVVRPPPLPLIYLACPYRHDERAVRVYRFECVTKVAGELMRQGKVVFSPITHCHPIASAVDLPTTWEYWQYFDRAFLERCSQLVVLCLWGWRESVGVQAEIAMAKELRIPTDYLCPPKTMRELP